MNKKISLITRSLIIVLVLYFAYFSGYSGSLCSGAGGKTAIINMHYERGMRFYKEREYDKAIGEFQRVLEIEPNNKNAKRYLGEAQKKKNKDEVDKLYKQASNYMAQKDYQKALETYDAVLKIAPNDEYSLFKEEYLKAKIEKLSKLQESSKYRAQKRAEELERLTKERIEKENMLKKQAALELMRKEKEAERKDLERKIDEKIDKQFQSKDKELAAKVDLEKQTIVKQDQKFDEYAKNNEMAKDLDEVEQLTIEKEKAAAKEDAPVSASDLDKVKSSIFKGMSEKEKLYQIKLLYQLGKKYYSQGDYELATETFQQVIDLEGNPRILYTPYAKDFIDRIKDKEAIAVRRDKEREIEDIENDMINKVIDAAKVSSNPTPGTVNKDIIVQKPSTLPNVKDKLNTPVNMDFQDVDVVYVLDYLSDATGANIVMSSAVTKGKRAVSVKIKDMSLEEALRYVLKSAGLTYRVDKNVIWVASPEELNTEQMETRVYALNKGKGSYTQFKTLTTGSVGLGSAADIDKITTIKDVLQDSLSWPTGSKLVLDEHLGTLIITNTPYNLEMVEKILAKIDVEPVQVLIEARFVEVEFTDLKELGLDIKLNSNWAFKEKNGGMVTGLASGSGTNFTDTARQSEGLDLTYQGLLSKPQFQVVLHALEENKKVKTLSAPRITTLDNQMAAIKVVDEWIYPTRYEFQIVQQDLNGDGDFNDAGETRYENVPTDFVKRDVGILLRVIPSVGQQDDKITLTLIPEVSDGTADYFTYTGGVSLPKFTSRNLNTTIVVGNGDTVILGGLMKDNQTKVKTKIPILGDLPFIGKAFRKETNSVDRKNLLIFVTASIISSDGNSVKIRKVENSTENNP